MPATHGAHSSAPEAAAYEPASQASHAMAPVGAAAPTGHVLHLDAPAEAENAPAAHGMHAESSDWPVPAEYVPTTQPTQLKFLE